MYRCEICGNVFAEPVRVKYRENLDGENGWATFTEQTCPYCGGEDFNEEENEYEDQGYL